MAIAKMLDKDVRDAVKKKVIKQHIDDPTTLVVEELGLNYGRNRVDIAVVNGELHGYELKSDSDNLLRLPAQVKAYSSVMDKMTLVVGEKHAQEAILIIPDWWGVKVASMGKNGKVSLNTERRGKKNRDIIPLELVKLLWKDELISLLATRIEIDWRTKKLRRNDIYQLLIDTFTLNEIRDCVRTTMKCRSDWRCHE
nr:sce7726 family protein [Moraxella osloensis]